MQVKEIMTEGVEMIDSDTTVSEAARKMKLLEVGVLPVEQDNKIAGIITGRDIIVRAIAEDQDPQTTVVEDIMTSEVACCSQEESIEEAAKIMEDKHIHRLVVLDSANQPVGMLALSDIAVKAQNEHLTWELLECISEPSHPHR